MIEVMRGDWLTQGPRIAEFEGALAEYVGARNAVAFANGTAALHAAAAAAGLGPGKVAATSPLSFVASANCARYVGASVEFIDIEASTLNFDPSKVPDCDALIAVHYAGLPVDLARLNKRPQVIIEDAAHALGARTRAGMVGNCSNSDLCVFSFHAVKSITTGEGGAVTTNSEELDGQLRRFRHHGIVKTAKEGDWYSEIESVGFNYRLTDMQAALGKSQLARIERFIDRRNEIAERYRSHLADLPVHLPPAAPEGWRHSYHLFPIRVARRREVFDALRDANIGVQVHYVPIYRHPLYSDSGKPTLFPATERAYEELLSLPIFPDLSDEDQDFIIKTIGDLL